MWQFVQFRGHEYGLNQTPSTDDRMDPEQATRAAARHLRDLYATFGDWYLALAAYNCGPGCVDHAVQRTGYADFWELKSRNVLPKETNNYVPVILAITIMAKNAKDYDLTDIELDQPLEYDTVTTDAPTSLALIADAADRPLPEIQELNPAVLKQVAPSGYPLRVPKGTASTVLTALDCVPADHRANWRLHRVSDGETLATIGHRYSTSPATLVAVNENTPDPPEVGDILVIPVANRVAVARPALAPAAKSTAHRRPVSRPVASKSAPAVTPVHKTSPAAYRTASITPKRRPNAN
jgi:membrane-bound lytic murein transglycosylase D